MLREEALMGAQYEGYPSNFEEFRNQEEYGHGGVRIYRITPDQAKLIHKELKMDAPLQKFREGDQYYYLNEGHGEHHIIFAFGKTTSTHE
jgi:hypothetical protein